MVSIRKELLSVEEEAVDVRIGKRPRVSSLQVGSSTSSSSSNNIMVGFHKHEQHILNELIHHKDNLKIISIVGMGGIGKTTLASSVFKHPTVKDHFDICLWFTISQQYSIGEILRHLVDGGKSKEPNEDIAKLGENLHKKLFGQKYFIVLDDLWSPGAWDDINRYFPDCVNGSRVMITTRLSNVASFVASQEPYLIGFLKDSESWDLLRQSIFGDEGRPNLELEKIGMEIAKSCRGLPLAIIVIGRLLAKSNMTREDWKLVAKNVSSLCNLGDDEQNCLNILSLSYNNLPIHLKPCFLYMRKFPEDYKITATYLVQLWVAEGFIKLQSDKTLEEIAKEYLNELVDRNLFFVQRLDMNKSRKREEYGIHDLLWDLCLKESEKEQFVLSKRVQDMEIDVNTCYLCGGKETEHEFDPNGLPKLVLTIPSTSQVHRYMCHTCTVEYSKLRLVGVVGVERNFTARDYEELVLQTQVRHIFFVINVTLTFLSPSTFHLFWNLQHLELMEGPDGGLPCEIWNMPQLRHIESFHHSILPKPRYTNFKGKHAIILKNLYTLKGIEAFPCTVEVIDRIPNLTELSISEKLGSNWSPSLNLLVIDGIPNLTKLSISENLGSSWSPNLHLLAKLHKLEWLRLLRTSNDIGFPNSLKSLKVLHCNFPWEDVAVIGSLPSLETLQLKGTRGLEWNPMEGQFPQLKSLKFGWCELEAWRADQTHFPKLEYLDLEDMPRLKEIPLNIGDIATLRIISLKSCSAYAINSARLIREEQRSYENKSLEIYVNNWCI